MSMWQTLWQKIKDITRQLLTGKDNTTHDMGKWSWAICTASVLAHDFWQLQHNVKVDIKDLGIALSGIAVAHGVALGLKKDTEP